MIWPIDIHTLAFAAGGIGVTLLLFTLHYNYPNNQRTGLSYRTHTSFLEPSNTPCQIPAWKNLRKLDPLKPGQTVIGRNQYNSAESSVRLPASFSTYRKKCVSPASAPLTKAIYQDTFYFEPASLEHINKALRIYPLCHPDMPLRANCLLTKPTSAKNSHFSLPAEHSLVI